MNAIDRLIESDRKTPKRIACIGDSVTDVYVHGHLDTCQENCLKFMEDSRTTVDGGVANASRSLSHWHSPAAYFSNHRSIEPVKTRFIVNGKIVFRHDDDEMDVPAILAGSQKTAFAAMTSGNPSGILISDYSKGFLTPEFISQIIDYANKRDIPCVADAKREPELYRGATLKCNIDYARRFDVNPLDTPSYVITHGHKTPAIWCDGNMVERRHLNRPVECVSHVGAGDCFAATMTLALAHGLSLGDAATIAHSAGRCYVQHPHNRPPWPHELRRDLDPCQGKIIQSLGLPALRESIPGKIVFANGCFDLFGPHHLYLLNEARKHGDALVVGVNSDESVRHLKGMGRPVIPQEQRALLIAGLEAVDWVIVFDENTPATVMWQLKPDVRVVADMGRNFDGDQFAKEVVKIAPLEGWSTTSTVTKIMRMPS